MCCETILNKSWGKVDIFLFCTINRMKSLKRVKQLSLIQLRGGISWSHLQILGGLGP